MTDFNTDGKLASQLPAELSIDKLFQVHGSIPRNPLIADVCYRVGYIDSWGRGIEKISDACQQAGLPAPLIIERTGGIAVELIRSQVSESAVSERREGTIGTISDEASGKRRV